MELTLSHNTEKRFNQLEKIIEKGMNHFVEVGTALLLIREEKLYRCVFATFEEYCKERWGFAKSQAYRLIDAAKVSRILSPIGEIQPTRESQVRPLVQLPPEQQPEVWKKALETAPEGKITARHVEEIVAEVMGGLESKEEIINDEMVEDSAILKNLKRYWAMANAYERELFTAWLGKEGYYGKNN